MHRAALAAAFALGGVLVGLWLGRKRTDGVRDGFAGAVGRTALVRLKSLSALTGCDILVKLELCNPGGSVKDRAARAIVDVAVAQGHREIIEATAGNTGISLAMLCRQHGIKFTAVCPAKVSTEKQALLRTLGAELVVSPANAKRGEPMHFQTLAPELARQRGALYSNQFDNVANFEAHYRTTGPEIWDQTNHCVDAVAFATGTGGTIAGTGVYLKECNPNIKVYVVMIVHRFLTWHVCRCFWLTRRMRL